MALGLEVFGIVFAVAKKGIQCKFPSPNSIGFVTFQDLRQREGAANPFGGH